MRFGVDGLKNESSRPHKICYQIPKDVVATILMLRQQRHYGELTVKNHMSRIMKRLKTAIETKRRKLSAPPDMR